MDDNGNEARAYTATVKDVAARYGVSRASVYNWVDQTEIPHRRLGTVIRFNLDEVDEWASARDREPAETEVA